MESNKQRRSGSPGEGTVQSNKTCIRDLPYPDRLRALKLPSLRYRREGGDMLQTYKILHRLEDMPPDSLFHLAVEDSTRGHSMKLKKPRCRTALRQHFFNLRVIEKWKRLPEEVVTAPFHKCFQGKIGLVDWTVYHYLV